MLASPSLRSSVFALGRRLIAGMVALSLLLFCAIPVQPAQAALHTYPETDHQTMYRSRLSLRDNQDLSWQVIVFKRIKAGEVVDFKLRLVGFPGQVTLAHPANVILRQSALQAWEAEDQTQSDPQIASVIDSVGQYDMFEVMRSLDRSAPMELEVALVDETRSLLVPPYVVKEWLALKEQF